MKKFVNICVLNNTTITGLKKSNKMREESERISTILGEFSTYPPDQDRIS